MKLLLENFKCFEKAEIEVTGITMIVGKNNAGKSAICQAVESVYYGRSGDGYIRHGTDKCAVRIEQDDGHKISRIKGRDKPVVYVVDDKKYDKPGKKGHLDILKSLGIAEFQHGTEVTTLQIIRQFDPMFFVGEAPAAAFGVISTVVDDSKYQEVMKDIAGAIKISNQRVVVLDGLIQNYQTEEKALQERQQQSQKLLIESGPLMESASVYGVRWQGLQAIKENLDTLYSQQHELIAEHDRLSKVKLTGIEKVPGLIERLNRLVVLENDLGALCDDQKTLGDEKVQLDSVDLTGIETVPELLIKLVNLNRYRVTFERLNVSKRRGEAAKELLDKSALSEQEQITFNILPNEIGRLESLRAYQRSLARLNLQAKQLWSIRTGISKEYEQVLAEEEFVKKDLTACPFCDAALDGRHLH